ncbi:MAG TPA: hypothetical protein PKA00_06890 [Saprospiraceae bacterium]|nr:hypothetical protein [Saprospiraceae bacterium]HMQ82614.1 hypothetical protein [Saprospiraceae bacterium]
MTSPKPIRTQDRFLLFFIPMKLFFFLSHFSPYSRLSFVQRLGSTSLQKLADALSTTTDFLMNGGTEQVEAQLTDKELLRQFQEVEKLEADDKHLIKTYIDAFITKRQIQRLAQ